MRLLLALLLAASLAASLTAAPARASADYLSADLKAAVAALRRETAEAPKRERHFAFEDAPGAGEDSYYVRVIQANGGMAWSSPWWVTGARMP